MKFKLFDLYSDYLLSSFSATTATGMSALMDKAISHDQVSRMLNRRRLEPASHSAIRDCLECFVKEDGVTNADLFMPCCKTGQPDSNKQTVKLKKFTIICCLKACLEEGPRHGAKAFDARGTFDWLMEMLKKPTG